MKKPSIVYEKIEKEMDPFFTAFSKETEQLSIKILKDAKHKDIFPGTKPKGQAAAAIYIASILLKDRISQKQIAQLADVTDSIVRKRYIDLVRELQIKKKSK